MSQNFGNTSDITLGGAGTGATDAGTTRDTTTGAGSTGLTTGGGAATGAATAREGLAGTAQQYGQKITDAASTARDYVSDKLSVARDKIGDVDYRQAADQAKEYARQNPGQALLISAAAGFLLGLLLRGTRR